MNKSIFQQIFKEICFIGLINRDQCQELIQKVIKHYDSDKNDLMEIKDAGNLQSDCYKSINIDFSPSQTDVKKKDMLKYLIGKGKISVDDIELLCFKYFGGEISTTEIADFKRQNSTVY
ncbi:unnamed protein product (macronuclear) [Paramecium tetraurelia]|uniref:EF-hand domain-containing protein n=1 Tax=Paramecium tetraurelia TaxID=5888 RepID=A0EB00_PARTE|nr:uncharacterized protein GSPATT00025201001 [Paramecium tetraurelia]CAK92467.1 unnamed protein product [Paramecium tetraurelia]|eukprot:XP_001459864.1 hypothetical protein (macronuclear) [Paramecium tetraurelia strain d4-2]